MGSILKAKEYMSSSESRDSLKPKEAQKLRQLSDSLKNTAKNQQSVTMMAEEYGQSLIMLSTGKSLSIKELVHTTLISRFITPANLELFKKDSLWLTTQLTKSLYIQWIQKPMHIKAIQMYLHAIARRDSLPQNIKVTGQLTNADFEVVFNEAKKNLNYSLLDPHTQSMLNSIHITQLPRISSSLNTKSLHIESSQDPAILRIQKLNILLVLCGYREIKTINGKENKNLTSLTNTSNAIIQYKKKFGIEPSTNSEITKNLLISLTKTSGLSTAIKCDTNQSIPCFIAEKEGEPIAKWCADFVLDSLSKSYFGKSWNAKNKMRFKSYCGAGDAWTLCADIMWKKWEIIMNVFDKPNTTLKTSWDVRKFIESKLVANKDKIEQIVKTPNMLHIWDIVGLYYKDSPSQMKAYNERNKETMTYPATYNTHVWYISGFTDTGEAIVSHYIHGHGIYHQMISEMTDTHNRTNSAVAWIARPRTMDANHQLSGLDDLKADVLAMLGQE